MATTAAVLLVLGVWQIASLWVGPDSRVLASPATVWSTGITMVETGELTGYLSRSLRTLLISSAIALAVGVPLGIGIGMSSLLASSTELTLRFMRNVSAIALLPLFVVWFGLGVTSVYAVALYMMLVVVIYNALGVVRAVPRKYTNVVRTLGGGWRRQVLDVYLPASLPGIVTGARLCVSYGWRAVVGGELVLSTTGVGGLLAAGRAEGRVDVILLGMVVIGLTNLILEALVLVPVERVVARRYGTT